MRFLDRPVVIPGTRDDVNICSMLFQRDFLRIGKETPLNAFAPGTEEGQFTYSPELICWRFPMPADSASLSDIGAALRRRLTGGSDHIVRIKEIESLWWYVARNEAYAHLNREAREYRWSIPEGTSLESAMGYALEKFSIPQLRTLIWFAVRDAAAYAQKAGVFSLQAIRSIPGNLMRLTDRYAANGYELKPYVMSWATKEPLLITVLFDTVLQSGVAGFRTLTASMLREDYPPTLAGSSTNPPTGHSPHTPSRTQM